MFRRTLAVLLPAGLLAAPASVLAAPRSASDCENLKNDLAYNQCLAMFGPAAKNIAAGGSGSGGRAAIAVPPPVDTEAATGVPSVEEPELRESPRRGSRRYRSYRRGGRQSASFEVGGDTTAVVERSESRRSRYRSRRRR